MQIGYAGLKPGTVEKFIKACDKVAEVLGKPFNDIVLEQMGIVVAKAIKFTPPKTEKQGKKRVVVDFKKIWAFAIPKSAPDGTFKRNLRRYIKKKDWNSVNTMLQRAHIQGIGKDFDAKDHYRDRKGHAVPRQQKIFTDFAAVKNYAEIEKNMVGTEKNGWRAGADFLKITMPDFTQGKPSHGSVYHEVNKSRIDLKIKNTSFGIQTADNENRILESAFKGRASAMIKRAAFLIKEAANKVGI